jgi:hypothetical protein
VLVDIPPPRPFNIDQVPAEQRPKFWLDEITGRLKPVVERYYRGDQLGDLGCALMREYLEQWIDSPVWDQSCLEFPTQYLLVKAGQRRELRRLRRWVRTLRSSADIREWLIAAAEMGIEPL